MLAVVNKASGRLRLGETSSLDDVEEFCALMEQREQDHKNWLAELEACVKEGRPFTLPLDPTQCAFGKRYYSYQPSNNAIAMILADFDAPHRAVHAIGAEAIRLAGAGDRTGAAEITEHTRRGVLSELVRLLDTLRDSIRKTHREVAIVLSSMSRDVAVCIDTVESFEDVDSGSIESLAATLPAISANCVAGALTRLSGGELVLLMEAARVIENVLVPEVPPSVAA